jgi:hypothetical protein
MMSSSRSVVMSGLVACLLAFGIIAASILSSFPTGAGSLTQSLTTQSPQTTQTIATSTPARATSSASTSSVSLMGGTPGALSILLTDPPHVPAGVTKVYVNYSTLSVHQTGSTAGKGWVLLKAAGEVELLGTVNVGQTLSSAHVPVGTYDLVRFNVTAALVTFQGKNYTAFVEGAEITAPILGGVQVTNASSGAAILDILPTVFNIGSPTTPEFVIKADARAFRVPTIEVSGDIEHEGHRLSLLGKQWWTDDEQGQSANLHIWKAALSATSLSLSINNTGSASALIHLVIVSQYSGSMTEHSDEIPSALSGSAVFVIFANGSLASLHLQPGKVIPYISLENQSVLPGLFPVGGFNLTAGSQVSLSYSGPINLSFGEDNPQQALTSGQQYKITVIDEGALATTVVVAT